MSRSIRLTRIQEPKSSARSAMPIPNVSGQFDTSVKPWLLSKLTRYALIDHFLRGSTSPVGTYQRPVSPMKVVVAGRVSVLAAFAAELCCGVADWLLDAVPVVVDCAAAPDATASVKTA